MKYKGQSAGNQSFYKWVGSSETIRKAPFIYTL
jgi:hypothetical protein